MLRPDCSRSKHRGRENCWEAVGVTQRRRGCTDQMRSGMVAAAVVVVAVAWWQ